MKYTTTRIGLWSWCVSSKLCPAGKWLIFRLGSGDNLSSIITLPLHLLSLFPFQSRSAAVSGRWKRQRQTALITLA